MLPGSCGPDHAVLSPIAAHINDGAVTHLYRASGSARQNVIVCYNNYCRSIVIEALEERDYFRPGGRVQLAGRLIGEKKRGVVGQCARDRYALLLAT